MYKHISTVVCSARNELEVFRDIVDAVNRLTPDTPWVHTGEVVVEDVPM